MALLMNNLRAVLVPRPELLGHIWLDSRSMAIMVPTDYGTAALVVARCEFGRTGTTGVFLLSSLPSTFPGHRALSPEAVGY